MRDRIRALGYLINPGKEKNFGYCHCCRRRTIFVVLRAWLRDNYRCIWCFSIPRQRHLQYVLDTQFENWPQLKIHESSPSNHFISQYCRGYSSSQYFENIASGSYVNGIRSENLEQLSFSDCCFDLFVTQDVFEHIFNPSVALREIMRVLKPGGAHVWTAPKTAGLSKSFRRAELEQGKINYLVEASYHANPVGDGKSLVTWDYGDDFESLILEWCGSPTTTSLVRDRKLGLDGKFLEVFVTRKKM
jgi:hypothetical protein